MNKILIVGYGVVGSNLSKELSRLDPDVYDKFKSDCNKITTDKYDLIFICVDTPYTEKDINDLSALNQAIEESLSKLKNDGIICIKSTVLPDKAQELIVKYGTNVIFSPEYYGATPSSNNMVFDFTILGGYKASCIKVQQILQHAYNGNHKFRITDEKTAMLAKYMENSWLATKVSFCSQFYDIAKNMGVYYEDLRELFLLDPRVNPSHTYIFREHPYWDSHCLNKDVPAIAQATNAELLSNVVNFNNKLKSQSNGTII